MRTIFLLGLVSLFTDISSEMVYPLIPLYLTNVLGATPAIVGLIEGIAESLASMLKVFSGYYSDKIDRRKPLAIAGYSMAGIGKLFLFFAFSWVGVLMGRVTDRFGKGIRTAPRDALIARASHKIELGKAYGLHRSMDTLGAASGILLSFFLFTAYQGGYKLIFLLALIPAALGVGVLTLVKEGRTKVEPQNRRPLSLNWRMLDTRSKLFLLVVLLFTLGNSSNQFLLLRASDIGFKPGTIILLYFTFNIVYAVFSYPAGRLSDKKGRKGFLVLGYAFYGLVYLGFATVHTPAYLWGLFILYGLYHALTQGVERALVAEIAPKGFEGTLLGLHATLVGIGLLPASWLAGILWTLYGSSLPFYLGGIIGLLAAMALWLVLPQNGLPANQT